MAQSNPNLTDIFTDVANAIREKKGTSAEIHPVDFADEIASITGGGDQPQLHAVTGLAQTAGVATWVGDSYTEAYKIYLDSSLVETITNAYYNIASLTVSVGSHTLGVAAAATNFVDATPTTLSFAKRSITVNIVDGTYSGPSEMLEFDTAQITITPNEGLAVEITSVANAQYSFTPSTGILIISNPVGNVVVNIECKEDVKYIIGFSGMSQSNPALTRTDDAVGATWTVSNGAIEVTGIDMAKVWGGYEGNNGESLTWDATSQKYLYNGEEYTNNVFSVIKKFFIKPSYVTIDDEQVLDGFQLCYSPTAPDATWQDWFYDHDHVSIGCYKYAATDLSTGLKSIQGVSGSSYNAQKSPAQIVESYKRNTTTSGNLHAKWFNEDAILQVLFMTIFATRQTTDVFPATAQRNMSSSGPTGYLDNQRHSSSIATYYQTTNNNGNMFLGIEDFVGGGPELVVGVVINSSYGTNQLQTSMDYANFDYSNTYPNSDIIINIKSYEEICRMQSSANAIGLLFPITTVDNKSFNTYFCDQIQNTPSPYASGVYGYSTGSAGTINGNPTDVGYGVFYVNCEGALWDTYLATRLCRTPA